MDMPQPISRAASAANREIIEHLVAGVEAGREAEALAEIETLLDGEPDHPAALYGLVCLALHHQKALTAIEALRRAHQRDPNEPLFAETLALLHAGAGHLSGAAYFAKLSACLGCDATVQLLLPPSLPRLSLALESINEEPHLRRAEVLAAAHRYDQAIEPYQVHLAFFAEDPRATRGLARCFLKTGQPIRALALLASVRDEGRATAEDLMLLAEGYAALGEGATAADLHDEALALDPGNIAAICSRLADAVLDARRDEAALVALARTWAATLPPAAAPAGPALPLDGRRIRLGYLASATRDPRDLEVLAVVAAASDPRRFEIYLYGYRSIDDPANAPLRGCYDEWRDVSECDGAALAAIVAGDAIDVLIDIGGFAAPLHLETMARRPAPWQVSWLGNPFSLGLDGIELADPAEPALPPGPGRRLALPHGLVCYDFLGASAGVSAGRGGPVTFGTDAALAQLQPDLVGCWAEILAGVPDSVLALRDRGFIEGGLFDHLLELFARHGIAERVHMVNLDAAGFHGEVDIMLAPFVAADPHDSAGALLAGLPVVALAGAGRHRGQAAALLRNAGLERLVAADPAGYVALAVGLGRSEAAREAAAAAVADALAQAPVFDPSRFAAAFDAALLDIVGQPA